MPTASPIRPPITTLTMLKNWRSCFWLMTTPSRGLPLRGVDSVDEGRHARQERVVALDCHQPDQDEQAQRRQQYCELERQALPLHVHEDGEDKSRLDDHEGQDQRPAQCAVQVKVVDQIRKRTDYEQRHPDD